MTTLLDLPRPFLAKLWKNVSEFRDRHSLCCVAKCSYDTFTSLEPCGATAVLWGTHQQKRLSLILEMGLGTLLLPDSATTCEYTSVKPGLHTLVLNYRQVCCRMDTLDPHAVALQPTVVLPRP